MYDKNYTLENMLTAHTFDDAFGLCSGCCFRNYRRVCQYLTCYQEKDNKLISYYWLLAKGTENDASFLWSKFWDKHKNTVRADAEKLSLQKIAVAVHHKSRWDIR